jgi:hypothetical protein
MISRASALEISLNMLHMSRDMQQRVEQVRERGPPGREMYVEISALMVWKMKEVPPRMPMAKLYGSRYLVKRGVLFFTKHEVKARRRLPPTAIGRSFSG